MRQINEAGINLIKNFEGLALRPYQDSVGIWTIGYGHTLGVDAETPEIDDEEADALLIDDLDTVEQSVERLVKVPLTDNQFSALVCLCFNVGVKPISGGTLGKLLSQGNYEEAADEFLKWNHAAGKVLNGLTRRREAERALFLLTN